MHCRAFLSNPVPHCRTSLEPECIAQLTSLLVLSFPLNPCFLAALLVRAALQNFPFDSWELQIALEFADTSPPGHPGLSLHTSSGGITLYTQVNAFGCFGC